MTMTNVTNVTNTAARLAEPDHPRLFTLHNAHGMRVAISEWGAALVSWRAPDRYGRSADVLLGYREPREYAANAACFGAIVGRWANRIADGRFALDGKPLQAAVNDRGHHLHGGPQGFHAARWRGEASGPRVALRLDSPRGQGGFPGNVEVRVDYELGDDGSLSIEYEAVADAATPFDFRSPAAIGPRLRWLDPQVGLAGGFDHCYCVGSDPGGRHGPLREVARVCDAVSGRRLQVSTTEDMRHAGFCLQAGAYPDQVNGEHAGAVILRPGQVYRQTTVYRLSLQG